MATPTLITQSLSAEKTAAGKLKITCTGRNTNTSNTLTVGTVRISSGSIRKDISVEIGKSPIYISDYDKEYSLVAYTKSNQKELSANSISLSTNPSSFLHTNGYNFTSGNYYYVDLTFYSNATSILLASLTNSTVTNDFYASGFCLGDLTVNDTLVDIDSGFNFSNNGESITISNDTITDETKYSCKLYFGDGNLITDDAIYYFLLSANSSTNLYCNIYYKLNISATTVTALSVSSPVTFDESDTTPYINGSSQEIDVTTDPAGATWSISSTLPVGDQ